MKQQLVEGLIFNTLNKKGIVTIEEAQFFENIVQDVQDGMSEPEVSQLDKSTFSTVAKMADMGGNPEDIANMGKVVTDRSTNYPQLDTLAKMGNNDIMTLKNNPEDAAMFGKSLTDAGVYDPNVSDAEATRNLIRSQVTNDPNVLKYFATDDDVNKYFPKK